jgi:hypothetical protein
MHGADQPTVTDPQQPGRQGRGRHPHFSRHIGRNASIALAALAISLGGGMAGYATFEGMGAVDAFVNAAMIVSGMGPISDPRSDAGKIFAGCYALYSGMMLVAIWGLVLSPFLHRILTRLHVA